MFSQLRQWARAVRRDALAVFLAAREDRVPWYAKALALVVAGYAFSPIDLIPDFIPILGLLDDVIIVPLGILAVSKLIAPDVMADLRARADALAEKPSSLVAALVIVVIWLGVAVALVWGLAHAFSEGILEFVT